MLNGTVNRKIENCKKLQVGGLYRIVDIYHIRVDGRLAIVGGVVSESEGSGTVYVWMPTSLIRNFNEQTVATVKKSVDAGKVARFKYNGMKVGRNGEYYDAEWVKKA